MKTEITLVSTHPKYQGEMPKTNVFGIKMNNSVGKNDQQNWPRPSVATRRPTMGRKRVDNGRNPFLKIGFSSPSYTPLANPPSSQITRTDTKTPKNCQIIQEIHRRSLEDPPTLWAVASRIALLASEAFHSPTHY